MKANRKFVEGEEAVSAVIGVILMVAITVAIAATVYVYVSGMLTTTPASGKTVSCIQSIVDTTTHNVTYKVTSADAGIPWGQVSASWANGSVTAGLLIDATYDVLTGNIAVGNYFVVDLSNAGTYTIDLIYEGNIIWTSPAVSA